MNEAEILQTTYLDTCKVVKKTLKKTNTLDSYSPEVIYENEPCALSMTQGSTSGLDTVQKIEYIAKLFASPKVVIKAGDIVTVKRTVGTVTNSITFTAGEPVLYPSHIEVPLIRKDIA